MSQHDSRSTVYNVPLTNASVDGKCIALHILCQRIKFWPLTNMFLPESAAAPPLPSPPPRHATTVIIQCTYWMLGFISRGLALAAKSRRPSPKKNSTHTPCVCRCVRKNKPTVLTAHKQPESLEQDPARRLLTSLSCGYYFKLSYCNNCSIVKMHCFEFLCGRGVYNTDRILIFAP